jgi:hypothetical protein
VLATQTQSKEKQTTVLATQTQSKEKQATVFARVLAACMYKLHLDFQVKNLEIITTTLI